MKNVFLFAFLVTAIICPFVAKSQTNTIVKIIGKDTITSALPFDTRDTLRKKYTYVEKMPVFPGDIDQYIKAHLRYPADAKNKKIEGTVVVSFMLDKEGIVRNPEVVKHVYPSLDSEAIRIIQHMPRWHPGIKGGAPYAVQFNLPIEFTR